MANAQNAPKIKIIKEINNLDKMYLCKKNILKERMSI